jgi:hypothetical protein
MYDEDLERDIQIDLCVDELDENLTALVKTYVKGGRSFSYYRNAPDRFIKHVQATLIRLLDIDTKTNKSFQRLNMEVTPWEVAKEQYTNISKQDQI